MHVGGGDQGDDDEQKGEERGKALSRQIESPGKYLTSQTPKTNPPPPSRTAATAGTPPSGGTAGTAMPRVDVGQSRGNTFTTGSRYAIM